MNKGRSKKYNFADPRGQPLIQKTDFFSPRLIASQPLSLENKIKIKRIVLTIISAIQFWELFLMLPLEKRDWKQITLVRNCFFFLEQLFASIQSCWGLVSFTSLSSEFSSDRLMYDIDWLTDRRTNGQTDRLPNKLSVCLTYWLSHRPNNRPINWKIEALTGRGMSESLQTCSITRSSWSSNFCSPDYDETHTQKKTNLKKFQNSRFLIAIRSPS